MAAIRSESVALSPGRSVVVRGKAGETEDGFSINLCAGETLESGCALHVNARPKDGKLVLNSYSGGAWGEEEREKLTIEKGQEFTIRIRAREVDFELFVNRRKLCNFVYRVPLEAVRHLIIKGDVQIGSTFVGGQFFPLPYTFHIPGGFGPGRRFVLHAAPAEEGSVDAFAINFCNAAGDIIFHFNPRWNEKAVVRNAKVGPAWGPEERAGDFPFDKKETLEMEVDSESYSYQISANGNLFCTFAHRGSPDSVVKAVVEGDIEIHDIRCN